MVEASSPVVPGELGKVEREINFRIVFYVLERKNGPTGQEQLHQLKEDWEKALSGEELLETKFEYVDMFHFFMNIGLLLGIDGNELAELYYLKNKENFARQERGY